ncbi:MAG: aldo/keto reductase [Solobacterium sp.]|nr:aldo/keto reductase [Solobacterium sp.]
MEYVTLNTGAKMPQVGFGVFQIPDADECKRVVLDAIKAGYRSFDTAASYMNEEAVGAAIKEAIETGLVTREELFITSKMWVQDMKNYDMAKKAIETSLEKLGLEYLDLYLLHQAMGDYFSAYRAMEDAYKEGKLKAIGVSNFFPNVLMNLVENVEIKPAVNQVELHPFFAQTAALENMKELGIQPEAWAPLAEGKHGIFTDPELTAIGAKYGKSAAQVVLKWNVQRGVVILPKSTKPERMAQNKDLFDFTLTDEEMEQITAKSLDHSEIINHFDPKLVQFLNRRNIHD